MSASRICPSCGAVHDRTAHAGCCSRGCMRFHKRRSAPAAKRAPRPTSLARELVAAVLTTAPVTAAVPPPPSVDMIRCDVCQKPAPDWATYEIDGRKVCCTCWPAYMERKRARDDRARPGGPDLGGGVRVIRSANGLS